MTHNRPYLNLAFSSDANFFIGLETAFASTIVSSHENTKTFNTYIVSDGITNVQENQLRELASELEQRYSITIHVHWLEFRESDLVRFETLKDSITFYARLILSDLVPDQDWIVWIDADIISRKDLSGIDSYVCDGAPVAGSVDFALPTLGEEGGSIDLINTKALDISLPYINTGFCVINLKVWREESLSDQLITWSARNQHLTRLRDQSTINWNLADRFTLLPEAYNTVVNKRILVAEDFSNPVNLHFAGSLNPWQMDLHWTVKYAPRDLRYLFACYEFFATRIKDMGRHDVELLKEFLIVARSGKRLLTKRSIRISLRLRVFYHQVMGRKERIDRWIVRRDFFCQEVPKQLDKLNEIISEIEEAIQNSPSHPSS